MKKEKYGCQLEKGVSFSHPIGRRYVAPRVTTTIKECKKSPRLRWSYLPQIGYENN